MGEIMRRAPATAIPEGFALTPATEEFMVEEFATIDIERTLKIFRDKAEAGGWMYTNWQAAFRNYVRNGKQYGGVEFRAGKVQDPRWQPILHEARKYGFREPTAYESPQGYKTAFDLWKTSSHKKTAPSNVVDVRNALKGIS